LEPQKTPPRPVRLLGVHSHLHMPRAAASQPPLPLPLPPLRPPKPATTSRGARPVLRHPPPHGARSRVPGDGSGSSASMVARPRDPLQWRRRPSRRRCVRDGGRASGLPFTLTLILCSKKP
jgi:hypothetical protein